jgi:ankyrin repeat protein
MIAKRGRGWRLRFGAGLVACALAGWFGGGAGRAQSTVDPAAGPLYVPIEQLQASPKWRVFAAVVTHDHKTLAALLAGGDSPNNFSIRYRLPITMACQLGDLDAVKILVEGRADVNLFDAEDENALIDAALYGHEEIARYLLAHGSKANLMSPASGGTALFIALNADNTDMLKLLIQGGANVNQADKEGETPLMIASSGGDAEMVAFLKGMGAKFNSPSEEFFCAASRGDVDALKRILADGDGAKHHGWLYRHLFAGRLELQKRTWTDSVVNASYGNATTPLMAAAGTGQTDAVKLLIATGARSNALDAAGDTALMYGLKSKQRATVLALLDSGADATLANRGGINALVQAATYLDDAEIVRMLIGRGVPPGAGSSTNETPLMAAACFGRVETVKILLEAHVPVNAQSNEGLTALAEAAISGESDVLKLLLQAGADPAIQDGVGKTALDYAKQQGHESAEAILKKAQETVAQKTAAGAAE